MRTLLAIAVLLSATVRATAQISAMPRSGQAADSLFAVATLTAEEVQRAPGGIMEALQGNIAGVNVSGGKIRFRGTSSLFDTDPLWVIDGIVGSPDDVPNNDEIASVQVLKDAASTALYGVRGANGVIVVTTKRGREGKPRISFNMFAGIGTPHKRVEMLNAHDYAVYVNELFYTSAGGNSGSNWSQYVPENNISPSQQPIHTDWQDEYFFDNFYQQYNISVSGGSRPLNYRFGATYTADSQQGVARNSGEENVFGSIGGSSGRFEYGGSFRVAHNRDKGTGNGSLLSLLSSAPNVPVYDPLAEEINGGYYNSFPLEGFDNIDDRVNIPNQAFYIHEDRNRQRAWAVQGNVYAQVRLIDGLKFGVGYQYSLYKNNDKRFVPRYKLELSQLMSNYQSTNTLRNERNQLETSLNYHKQFGQHNLAVMASVVSERYHTKSVYSSGYSRDMTDFGDPEEFPESSHENTFRRKTHYFSVLANLQYSYADKYLLAANFRTDKIVRKSLKKNQFSSNFPSFAAGWDISKEKWMSRYTSSWLNRLMLHGSLGWTGSSPERFIEQTISGTTDETTREIGVGFDLSTFDNRLRVQLDYYHRRTTDMLFEVYEDGMSVMNIDGSRMTNQGVEFSAAWSDRKGDFAYTISPNFSVYRNKVDNLGLGNGYLTSGSNNYYHAGVSRTISGKPVAHFWGLKTAGLFRSDAEAKSYIIHDQQIQPKAGDLKYVDLNDDGILDMEDYTVLGSSMPTLSAGLNIALSYKHFDLSTLLQGDFGMDAWNEFKYCMTNVIAHGESRRNQPNSIKNAYRADDISFTTQSDETIHLPKHTHTDIPRITSTSANRISDYFVEDASYLRCNYITLGYTLSEKLRKQIRVERLRFYLGVKNPFTITGYSMFDPQVPGDGSTLTRGIDSGTDTYVSRREYFAGIQLTL
jgi:TonB-dependent SusC/RagA subfamily outer membrane receptor